MLKLNKLFYTTADDVFYDRIKPSTAQRSYLMDCKNDIRDYLKPRISKATVKVLGMEEAVEPRFRTQGSWAYKTCVQPAHSPDQEMDWDFGVYLPVRVWEDNGQPRAMAKAYFNLVEGILSALCKEKSWTLNTEKQTCIRIHVSNWAHIDIPLYAAPEEKFTEIIEKSLALESMQKAITADSAGDYEEAGVEEPLQQAWEDLDEIVLATRSGEWRQSDPEAVSRWFNDRVAQHGEQLRRVCRYVKAWRDFHWPDGGGPSSVCIMIAIGQTFEQQPRRDDLALEKSVIQLANLVKNDIRENAIDDGLADFNASLTEDKKAEASNKALDLATALCRSRSYAVAMTGQAVSELQSQFGMRIPSRNDLVSADDGYESIRSIPAERVPAPIVKATSAG